jgi:hypothetical protein
MLSFLSQLPDFYLFLGISVTFIVVSITATLIIRLTTPAHTRSRDNAVIASTSNVISLIYGVLVGISALYLINNNNYTADAVQREANAVADVYRDSRWLPEPLKTKVQNKIKIYLTQVIQEEWPMMQKGKRITHKNDRVIDSIMGEVIQHSSLNNTEGILQKDILMNLKNLYDARQQRIHMSYSVLDPELWVVILIGTILTLCINYIYDMNFYIHLVTITAAALMTASMIFLLIALDTPFQGEFIIQPNAMRSVLAYMTE